MPAMAIEEALATDQLKAEHKVIIRMLNVVEAACERLQKAESIPAQVFDEAIDFIRNFADKCHHGKEQDTLFPLMGERGFPTDTGPIAVMLVEHDKGREFVRRLVEAVKRYAAGDEGAKAGIVQNAMGYVELLRQHIYKEDNILYPMGDKVLTGEDNRRLLEEFERIESDVVGAAKHERYLQTIEKIEKELGIVGGVDSQHN